MISKNTQTMLKLKTLLYTILLFVSMGFTKKTLAQTGATCASAYSLSISPGQSTGWETTANDTVWYNFAASAPVCYFTFHTSLTNKRAVKDVVYGVCGSFPNVYTLIRGNDTTFYLAFSKLTVSNNYKLGIVFGESGYCETCSNIGAYKLDFTSIAEVASTCTASCAGAPVCNYLCNGDFEQTSATPVDEGDLNACNWSSANGATPDLFSVSSPTASTFTVSIPSNFVGCESVHLTGNNYAGFFSAPNFYEAVVSPLSANLINGRTYQISFWLSQAEMSIGNVNNIAFAFTNGYTAPTAVNAFSSIPSSSITAINTTGIGKTGWVNRTYNYIANGTENRFIIGAINGTVTSNGNSQSSTAGCAATYGPLDASYYYIDDIVIKEALTLSVTPAPCFTLSTISVVPSNIGTVYSWSSTPPTATLSTQTGYSINVSPTVTTNYSVSTTNTLGCIVSNTISTILPVMTVNSSTVNFCVGSSTAITVPNLTTFTWTAHPTITGNLNNPTITVTPTATTIYTVVGNITGCPNTYTANVTLFNVANAFSLTSTTVCTGMPVSAITNTTIADIIVVDFGDPTYTGGSYPNPYTYTNPGTYEVLVYGTDLITGCNPLATFTVTVNSAVTPTLTVTPSLTICAGQSTTLTANGASTYTWNPGVLTNSTIVVSPLSTTVYTVIGSSGCGTSSLTTTVTVLSIPSLTTTASPTIICAGNSSTLTAAGASTYTWQPSGATTASTSVSPTVTTIYTVTGMNSSGCSSTKTITVNVIANPILTCTPSSSLICPGSTATIIATALGATSFSWNPGAVSGATIVVTPTATTTYTAYAVAPGCGTKTNTITISLIPAPSLSVSPSVTICPNTSTTLTASGAITYTWNPGGLTGSSVVVTPTIATTYTVTGANSCSATSTQTVKVSFFKGIPSITATASPTFICAGTSSTLTMTGGGSFNGWLGGLACGGTTCVVSPSVTTTYTASTTSTVNGCTNTKTVTVVVGPFTSITANPVSVCAGQTATLTASGATTYTWYPGGTVHTAITVVTPTITSNYTVTGTNGSCPSGTVVLTVTVNASPTITVNSPTICAGGTATLTASGGTAYTWAPGGSTSVSITVSPTVATAYTVTGTGALGCTATAVSTVNISNGSIPSFSIVSPTGTICANGSGISPTTFSTTLGTNPLYGFAWIPGFSTSASPTIAITQPVSVKVTVTNLACGTSSVQDICVNYVASTCCNSTLTTLTNTTITDVSQIPNSMYRVSGTLTFSFSSVYVNSVLNKEFLMETGSKIVVSATSAAKLILHSCKLYSCSGMWEGIELQNNGTNAASIDINDNTTIEDAYRAVSAVSFSNNVGSNIVLNVAKFNKNYIDVYLQDWLSSGNTYSMQCLRSSFTSQTSTTSPGGNLKCSQYYSPTIKSRSYIGIHANNSTSVNIATTTTNTLDANYFNNKDYGIFFQKTSGLVSNALFSNMLGVKGTATVDPTGVGVAATTNASTPINISVTTVSAAVTFSNVQCAVFTKKVTDLSVLNTTIINPNQSNWVLGSISGYGYNGIYAEDTKRDLHLNYNKITNAWYGAQAVYTNTTNIGTLSISNNTITAASTKTTAVGINVSSAISFNGNPSVMPIAANTLSNVTTGVQLTALTGGVRVSGNDITMRSGNTSGTSGSGVYLAGGNTYCKIDNNNIHGNSTGSEATYNINKIGFNIKTSTNCLVQCNRMDYLGTGVRFDGVCTTTNTGFFNNEINYPIRRGLDLRNSASIGLQGTYNGIIPNHTVTAISMNSWGGGTWNSSITDQTYVVDAASNAGSSRLCVSNGGPGLPTDNQWFAGGGAVASDAYSTTLNNTLLTSATATAVTTCPSALTVGAKMAGTNTNDTLATEIRDEEYKRIITENLTDPMIPDESKWQLKEYMYRNLTDGAAPQDVTVQGFYNQEKTGSLHNFTLVDSLINTGDYNQASTINSSAPSVIITEQTTKDYNALWLNKFSDPDYVATSTDIADLEMMANLCIHKGGKSVAYARALLGAIYQHPTDYSDDCMDYKDNARKAKNVKTFETKGNNVLLFPNPNNGNFTLSYQLVNVTEADVKVEDITGKLIYVAKLNVQNRSIKMDLTNLRNGIYFVKVIGNKEIISVNKVIVNN
jgi:hypothetical protein